MNIELAKYMQDENGTNVCVRATIDGSVCDVPIDTDNRHYQAILEWVAEGNTIQEAD